MILTEGAVWTYRPEGNMFWFTVFVACAIMGGAVLAVAAFFRWIGRAVKHLIGA